VLLFELKLEYVTDTGDWIVLSGASGDIEGGVEVASDESSRSCPAVRAVGIAYRSVLDERSRKESIGRGGGGLSEDVWVLFLNREEDFFEARDGGEGFSRFLSLFCHVDKVTSHCLV